MPPPKMTKIQKEFIKDIENVLNITYTGGDHRKNASCFIDKHKVKYKAKSKVKRVSLPMSGKQKRLIKEIEKYLDGVKFTGKTALGAKRFIDYWYYDYVWERTQEEERNPALRVANYVRARNYAITRNQHNRMHQRIDDTFSE